MVQVTVIDVKYVKPPIVSSAFKHEPLRIVAYRFGSLSGTSTSALVVLAQQASRDLGSGASYGYYLLCILFPNKGGGILLVVSALFLCVSWC
jgi:hypothetical protein